jgi:hypothetical protein
MKKPSPATMAWLGTRYAYRDETRMTTQDVQIRGADYDQPFCFGRHGGVVHTATWSLLGVLGHLSLLTKTRGAALRHSFGGRTH